MLTFYNFLTCLFFIFLTWMFHSGLLSNVFRFFSELSARTPLTVPHCPVTRFDALPALSSDFNAARAAFAASDVAADLPIWCPQCYPLTENEVKSFFSLPDRFRYVSSPRQTLDSILFVKLFGNEAILLLLIYV